jgi:hypothetical protein
MALLVLHHATGKKRRAALHLRLAIVDIYVYYIACMVTQLAVAIHSKSCCSTVRTRLRLNSDRYTSSRVQLKVQLNVLCVAYARNIAKLQCMYRDMHLIVCAGYIQVKYLQFYAVFQVLRA